MRVQAFQTLAVTVKPRDVVLSEYVTGNALPAWLPGRVVIGHGPESANLSMIYPKVKAIFSERESEEIRQDFFRKFNIHYVFWGPHERASGAWKPELSQWLECIYRSENYAIFKTRISTLTAWQ